MELRVAPDDPRAPDVTALLEASHALMQSLYPAESNHYLSVDELTSADVRFFSARLGDATVGCAALAIKDGYGELKSMFVAPEARGSGAATELMEALEVTAREEDLHLLRLETGEKLAAAIRLYERFGFARCGPFGDYGDDPLSVFMEKQLA